MSWLAGKGWFMASYYCTAFVPVAGPRWLLPPQLGHCSHCLWAALLWGAMYSLAAGYPVPTGLSCHSTAIDTVPQFRSLLVRD